MNIDDGRKILALHLQVVPLTPELARKYEGDICASLNQIPEVEPHTLDYLLMEQKRDKILHKKWDHSFLLLDGDQYVGVAIGYERDAEGNEQYPEPSIYMNDLSIAQKYQKRGLGKSLVETWLQKNTEKGFLELQGRLRFAVQTNSAEWNSYVQKLYESFGFTKIAEKKYENRVDNVYVLEP